MMCDVVMQGVSCERMTCLRFAHTKQQWRLIRVSEHPSHDLQSLFNAHACMPPPNLGHIYSVVGWKFDTNLLNYTHVKRHT